MYIRLGKKVSLGPGLGAVIARYVRQTIVCSKGPKGPVLPTLMYISVAHKFAKLMYQRSKLSLCSLFNSWLAQGPCFGSMYCWSGQWPYFRELGNQIDLDQPVSLTNLQFSINTYFLSLWSNKIKAFRCKLNVPFHDYQEEVYFSFFQILCTILKSQNICLPKWHEMNFKYQ